MKPRLKQSLFAEATALQVIAVVCALGFLSHGAIFLSQHIHAMAWLSPFASGFAVLALACALLILVGSVFYAFPMFVQRLALRWKVYLAPLPADAVSSSEPRNNTPPPRHHLH